MMSQDDDLNLSSPLRRPTARVENAIEMVLFAGRWLMAPIYLGLLVILGTITLKFLQEITIMVPHILSMEERDLVMFVLGLVDLALLGNLVLMVAFVGYENFVSKMHASEQHKDRPEWMSHVDFRGLKLKLLSSIVAISAIHLLRSFLDMNELSK